jgi:ribonuclease HI
LTGGEPATTNNRMELLAAIEALKSLPAGSAVTLTTDSTKVLPKRLIEIGYRFEHPTLEPALRDTLGLWK